MDNLSVPSFRIMQSLNDGSDRLSRNVGSYQSALCNIPTERRYRQPVTQWRDVISATPLRKPRKWEKWTVYWHRVGKRDKDFKTENSVIGSDCLQHSTVVCLAGSGYDLSDWSDCRHWASSLLTAGNWCQISWASAVWTHKHPFLILGLITLPQIAPVSHSPAPPTPQSQ